MELVLEAWPFLYLMFVALALIPFPDLVLWPPRLFGPGSASAEGSADLAAEPARLQPSLDPPNEFC
jgi:hypothetical protein